jgi:ankyrin repeat protein
MKLSQLVENLASIEVAGKPILRQLSHKTEQVKLQSVSKIQHRTRELLGTLLLASARWSLLPIVSELLHKGAEINKQDRFGYTPLMLAVKRGHTAVARYLVDQGANLEIRNLHHFTVLMVASFLGNTNMIKLLLKCGSNILAIDHRRMMSIHHAAYTGHNDAVQILGRELTTAGFTVDICAPPAEDIVAFRESELGEKQSGNTNVLISNNSQNNKHRGVRILSANMLTDQFSRVMRRGLNRITSVFRGGPEYNSTRALFLAGSLSRAVQSKRNLLGAYDSQLSEENEQTRFNPHELLLDRNLNSVVKLAMKRGMVEGLSPLALAVKAGHLNVVRCLVNMGADPTAYDSTVFSPYERALIKSGEE